MAESTPVASVLGRLIVVNSLVWAATMLAAVVMKASDAFIYLLLVLLAGSSLSGAAIESARRDCSRDARGRLSIVRLRFGGRRFLGHEDVGHGARQVNMGFRFRSMVIAATA